MVVLAFLVFLVVLVVLAVLAVLLVLVVLLAVRLVRLVMQRHRVRQGLRPNDPLVARDAKLRPSTAIATATIGSRLATASLCPRVAKTVRVPHRSADDANVRLKTRAVRTNRVGRRRAVVVRMLTTGAAVTTETTVKVVRGNVVIAASEVDLLSMKSLARSTMRHRVRPARVRPVRVRPVRVSSPRRKRSATRTPLASADVVPGRAAGLTHLVVLI